jgi:hypothetical protein
MQVEGQDDDALAEFLKVRARYGLFGEADYGPGGMTRVVEGLQPLVAKFRDFQRTLFSNYCRAWTEYESGRADLTMDNRQRFLLGAMLALGPRSEVHRLFIEKWRIELLAKLALQAPPHRSDDVNTRILEVMHAITHVETIFNAILQALSTDLPLLMGLPPYEGSGSIAPQFDPLSTARLISHAYFPAFQNEASKALVRINAATRKHIQDDPNGYPVCFYDYTDQERPHLDEEVLVLHVEGQAQVKLTSPRASIIAQAASPNASAEPVAGLRWWRANVKAAGSQAGRVVNSKELDVVLQESGERLQLRGNYFIRPSQHPHSSGAMNRDQFALNRRVLLKDDRSEAPYYLEGEIVKVSRVGTRG